MLDKQSNTMSIGYRSHRLNTALFWLILSIEIAQIVINLYTLPCAVLAYFIAKDVVGR